MYKFLTQNSFKMLVILMNFINILNSSDLKKLLWVYTQVFWTNENYYILEHNNFLILINSLKWVYILKKSIIN